MAVGIGMRIGHGCGDRSEDRTDRSEDRTWLWG